jgi:hypothetical protein
MTSPKITKEDANEAFFNLGKLAGKLSSDDGKRLYMLTQIVASYMAHLEEENKRLKNDDFDMDGRC